MPINAYVLKPPLPRAVESNALTFLGIVPASYATRKALGSFLKGTGHQSMVREADYFVFERSVRISSVDDVQRQAWGFASELKYTFGLPHVQVY